MPMYEYVCKKCGHELDEIQNFSDPPLTVCPACGTEALTRKMSLSSFHLKGSGWYTTDYARKGPASGESSSAPASGGEPSSTPAPSAPAGGE